MKKIPNNSLTVILMSALMLITGTVLLMMMKIHSNMNDIIIETTELELAEKFPLDSEDRLQLIENSDMRLRYHDSALMSLSYFIAIIGAVLTFAAFYIQYVFNKRQKKDLSQERMENQTFHLLDVLRTMCQNTFIANVGKGKVAFHYMFYEYKALYCRILDKGIVKSSDPKAINRIVFSIFIDGVSRSADIKLPKGCCATDGLKGLRDELLEAQRESEENPAADKGVRYIMDYRGKGIKYFDGHRIRLVTYFKYMTLILKHISGCSEDDYANNIDMSSYFVGETTEHELGLFYAWLSTLNDDRSAIRAEVSRMLRESENYERFMFDNPDFIAR